MRRDDFPVLLGLARSDAAADGTGPDDPAVALAALARLAASSGVRDEPLVPTICRGARRSGLWDRLSTPARDALDRARLEAVARALEQRRWLADALGDLAREDISCALLKGAAFNGILYPDDAPRLGGDIDLLVAERDFEAACRALNLRARPAGPRRDRRASHQAGYEVQFLTDGPFAVLVELHRALTIPHVFAIDHEALIERARPHPAYETERARMLDPEDALLHLAVHAFRHLRVEGHVLLDVHEVFVQWRPDAAVLLGRAGDWGACGALYSLLRAAREVCQTQVPEDLLASLRPGPVREQVGRQVYRFATARDLGLLDPGYRLTQLVSLAAVPDRPAGALRYGLRYAGWRALDLWERLRTGR